MIINIYFHTKKRIIITKINHYLRDDNSFINNKSEP